MKNKVYDPINDIYQGEVIRADEYIVEIECRVGLPKSTAFDSSCFTSPVKCGDWAIVTWGENGFEGKLI